LREKFQALESPEKLVFTDEFSEQAEKSRKLELIAKSNGLRKAAKMKHEEVTAVQQQLDAKLLELQQM
jgi:hypothetical protein